MKVTPAIAKKGSHDVTPLLDTVRSRVRRIAEPVFRPRHEELPPPDDSAVDPLAAFFLSRGWTIVDRDSHTTAILCYPGGFQGALDTDDRSLIALDLSLQELECELLLHGEHWIAKFSSCGVLIGCDRHRSIPVHIGVHGSPFVAVLGDLERHARLRRPRDIAHCLVFGACGHKDTPSQPCQLRSAPPDTPGTVHALPARGERVE